MRPKINATATSWRFPWGGRRPGQRDRAFLFFFFGMRLDGKRHAHTQDTWEDLHGRHATSFFFHVHGARCDPRRPSAQTRLFVADAPPSFFSKIKDALLLATSRGPSRRINARQQK
ncbi:hypothetical protein [Pandoravirus japonicus]|uniref:Uncharacterized protein n=1 Tax=Pandoravirus japonicus TaxID=2823154 RepID=A0A811BT23_9VIRU|nr:hypothetical protein [Pandoravirus japonicus]